MRALLDTRIGQLAIARGYLTLSELLGCVHECAVTGRELEDALLGTGRITAGQLREMREAVTAGGDDGIAAELERGQTMVLEDFARSRMDELTADGLIPGLGEVPTPTLDLDLDLDLELTHESRYELRQELGRGGMGRVFLARDRILQRDVAMKTLVEEARTEKGRARLLVEAQVTGLLEHPSIVPVYDLRSARDGEPFYTMRVVQERGLDQILSAMRKGEDDASLTSLVSILRQVSLALQFAHDRGVVHRDIKPENILIGRYGEVYVIDWGVAKIVNSSIGLSTTGKLMMGQLVGTPQYMAPEQARGDNDAVDERSDVYALGAVLYEILTLQSIFEADHLLAILFQVVHDPPIHPAERAPARRVPKDLADICLRALAKSPERRYQSAQEFADELELFLEGVKERERRVEMANDAIEHATQVRAIYEEVRLEFAAVVEELAAERLRVESWAPVEEKARLWGLEQNAEDLEIEIERRFGEVVRIYSQALVHLPSMPEARGALARLYWERFTEYEATGRFAQAAYFEGLVRQYSDGEYDELLEGTAQLKVDTEPHGASASILRFQPVDRRLAEWRMADVGPTPVESVSVPHGSYLLRMSLPGHRTTNVPLLVERGTPQAVTARLYRESEIPESFIVIPAGEFITGRVTPGVEVRREYLPDFAIARHPVTCREYIEFLNGLVDEGESALASELAPRDKDKIYFGLDAGGRFFLPEKDPEGDTWELEWPVIMVNLAGATEFAAWKSRVGGHRYRLPSIMELENAARGVYGRV